MNLSEEESKQVESYLRKKKSNQIQIKKALESKDNSIFVLAEFMPWHPNFVFWGYWRYLD